MTEKNTPILISRIISISENEITSRIRSPQYEALKAVNKEMIALYGKSAGGLPNNKRPWAGENPSWRTFRGTYKRSFWV